MAMKHIIKSMNNPTPPKGFFLTNFNTPLGARIYIFSCSRLRRGSELFIVL